MIVLRLDNLTFSHPGGLVLENLVWAIQDGQKLGLVGPNGAGKSTVLKLLAGYLPPDSGAVAQAKGVTVGYLDQDITLPPEKSVLAEAMTASPKLARIEAELQAVEAALGSPEVYENEVKLMKTLDKQNRLLQAYEEAGGLTYQSVVQSTLRRLGFDEQDFDLPISVLSGGQKKLLALAKLSVNQPKVLLLDEPDNHLDITGKTFLEGFINAYSGAVIIISHDRYLLDEVADGIVELAGGKFAFYTGNYSTYVAEKELRQLRQQQLYAAQQKEIARLEEAIKRFELWASLVVQERHIRQARNKRRQIEQMDRVDKPLEQGRMNLRLSGWRGSDKVLEIIELVKAFDDNLVLAGVNLLLWHGERVGLLGPNGAGKSVLFRCIMGQYPPDDGVVKIGPSVNMGVYTQEHQSLYYDKNLVDMVRHVKPMYDGEAVAFLNKFLFPYQQAREQTVGSLSGGERSRLQLALIMLQNPNFLLLDEPTNNIDIQSAEVLEEVLETFNGTLFVISHDRYFLDKVVDRVVELDPDSGVLNGYDGGYTDYLAIKWRVMNPCKNIF